MDAPANRLNLAHEAPFQLGQLQVEPAIRLVRNGASTEIVEPRVMQLLVALHDAGSQILSRDDLVQQCWGGVVVGNNAIQRAVSQARKIAEGIGAGSFEIESIRGVGYRLVTSSDAKEGIQPQAPSDTITATLLSRRAAVVTLVTVGAGAAAAALIGFGTPRAQASDLAQDLFRRADMARRDGAPDRLERAVSLYSDAVRDSPQFAKAWGALAATYIELLQMVPESDLDRFAALTRSAARRSLSLDSGNPDARAALLLVTPFFRNWAAIAPRLQRITEENPRQWFLHMQLGDLAADVGLVGKAQSEHRQALDVDPLLPRLHARVALALWSGDRLQEADEVFEIATRRWPRDWFLWNSRFLMLAQGGDLEGAERWITDQAARPRDLAPDALPKRLRLLRALQDDGELRQDVVGEYVREAAERPLHIRNATIALASLNARDQVFELLDGYFFGRGRFGMPIGPYSRRPSYFLFLPPFKPLHPDRRFQDLLQSTGIAAAATALRRLLN